MTPSHSLPISRLPASHGARRLTRGERRILAYIREHIAVQGESPAYQEIAAGIGIRSKGRVSAVVAALVAKGVLTRGPHRSPRSLALIQDNTFTVELPADLAGFARDLAEQVGVAPEAVLIEALRDGLGTVRAHFVSRETPKFAEAV